MNTKSMVRVVTTAVAVGAGSVLLVGCGSGGSGRSVTGSSGPDTVLIKNFTFSPSRLNVAAGTTVTVKNTDSSAHTLTANDGSFDTGSIAPGHSATFKAPATGTHSFHCTFHQFMTGTLTVSG